MKNALTLLITFAALMLYPGETYAQYPFEISGHFDTFGKAKFTTPEVKGQKFKYSEAEGEASAIIPFNSCNGMLISAGYTAVDLDWKDNPSFDEKTFSCLNLGLGGYTMAIPNWLWKTKLTISTDLKKGHHNSRLGYFVLWGKYDYCSNSFGPVNLHIGVWARTGLKNNLVLPILGADFQPLPCVQVNLIFPLDISAAYLLNDCWSISAKMRFWRQRFRLGDDEPVSHGVFEYMNTGYELGLTYDTHGHFMFNIHAGLSTGNGIKVVNSSGTPVIDYKFDSAGYAGAVASIRF